MTPLTEDVIRELAGIEGRAGPVTSCYLDVDGRRYPRRQDYEAELERMVRAARERRNGHAAVADADLRRIEDHVRAGVERSRTRGLAMFSCAADGFFRAFALPLPVHNQLVVNRTPHVRQLEALVDEYEPVAVLLADRQRARLFLFELGELVEREELFEELPRREDDDHTVRRDRLQDHTAVAAAQHLRHAAQAAFRLWQERPFSRLLVSAHDEIANELERELHPYLRERVAGRLTVPVTAKDDVVRQAALDAEARIERQTEAQLVQRLRQAVARGNGGVAGLEPTLTALVEGRVDTLLVSDGYEQPGWRCAGCGYVAAVGRTCPVCSAEMSGVGDVVEEAVQLALAQHGRVENCVGNADLDVLGRIGALLRY